MRSARGVDPPPPQLVSILRQGPYLIASIHTALDDGQLLRFQHELVDRIGRDRAYGIVIDVAALDVLDSFGARTLRNLAESAKLRGARTVVVGINPEVAFAMVQLGMGLDSVDTALDLEEGLAVLDAWLRGRRDVADGPVRGAGPGRGAGSSAPPVTRRP
jgi:rsbT antagonist protein RsbS